MTSTCSWLKSCPFFTKLDQSISDEVEKLIETYCKGPYQEQCIRKVYLKVHGKHADVCMTPSGKIFDLKE